MTIRLENHPSGSNLTTERAAAIDWLKTSGYPVLPVAPAQDPKQYYKRTKADATRQVWEHCPLTESLAPLPLYTGKNPSYLDRQGKPHLLNHRTYQQRLPSPKEIDTWFEHPANGIGTLGGWNNTTWLDFDVKCFPSQAECDAAVLKILEKPELQQTLIERSHSGGWRIAVKVKNWSGGKPFTNFALTTGGAHVGEALGTGRFTVLAPTVGPSGNAYQSLNRAEPVEVASLEAIGIYQSGRSKEPDSLPIPVRSERDWAIDYLNALHPSRADNYEEWLRVGMALHSIDVSLLPEWDNWSRQSSKYQPGECDRKWHSFKGNGVGIGSLAEWAKQDGWQHRGNRGESRPNRNNLVRLPVEHQSLEALRGACRDILRQDLPASELQLAQIQLRADNPGISEREIKRLLESVGQELELEQLRPERRQEVEDLLTLGDRLNPEQHARIKAWVELQNAARPPGAENHK